TTYDGGKEVTEFWQKSGKLSSRVEREPRDGKWVVTTTGGEPGLRTRTEVFDKRDGTLEKRTTSYTDRTVEGQGADGKWVETTTGADGVRTQTDVFDGPDGTLLERTTTDGENRTVKGERRPDGTWLETTTGADGVPTKTVILTGPGGKLLFRETTHDGYKE